MAKGSFVIAGGVVAEVTAVAVAAAAAAAADAVAATTAAIAAVDAVDTSFATPTAGEDTELLRAGRLGALRDVPATPAPDLLVLIGVLEAEARWPLPLPGAAGRLSCPGSAVRRAAHGAAAPSTLLAT